ncbi:MAG: aminotransferase class IV [Candidatus Melainabacteria bacterium]|nr:aminotransferase class IV [Candidatus Melainabacteria bacterium]
MIAFTNALANWNGTQMPLSEVKVSVLDRAFLFGDAVYEVVRVYGGKTFRFQEHLKRLERSLGELGIVGVDLERLNSRCKETVANSGEMEALVYIQVTRGEAKRAHCFPEKYTPNELIWVERFDDPYRQGRQAGVKVVTLKDIRWSRNDIKATSMVANCLAAQHAASNGCLESILIKDGFITEGSHTSVFAVKDNKLVVSPSSPNVLPGITKLLVIELAKQAGVQIVEDAVCQSAIFDMDEVFLSATPEEVLPVVTIDGRSIGRGNPGPITKRLIQAYENLKSGC